MSDTINTATGEVVAFTEDTGAVAQTARLIGDLSRLANGEAIDGFYNSLPAGTFAERVAVAKAVGSAKSIADNILARPVNLQHVIIQLAEMENEQTKQMQTVPRVVLVTEDGDAFYGFGGPLYRDTTNLLGMAGRPDTWGEPIVVQVNREGQGTRKYFTLDIIGLKSDVDAETEAKNKKS
ncbi:ssDNA binding protein [Curtobacterium phage Ayka]|nr:ssDNA binding protein [Curtobacterium phage Ayka]